MSTESNDLPMNGSNGESNRCDSVTLLGHKYDKPLFYFKTSKALAVKMQIGRWCKKAIKCMEKVFIRMVRTKEEQVTMRFISFDTLDIQVVNGTFAPNVWETAQFDSKNDTFFIDSSQLVAALADADSNQQELHWIAMPNGTHSIVLLKSGQSFSRVTDFWDQKIEEGVNIIDFQGSDVPDTPCLNITFKPDDLIPCLTHLEQISDDTNILKITASADCLTLDSGRSKSVLKIADGDTDEQAEGSTSTDSPPPSKSKWKFSRNELLMYFNMKITVQNIAWIATHTDVVMSLMEFPSDDSKMLLMFQQNQTFKDAKIADSGNNKEAMFSTTLSFLMNRAAPE